MCIVIISFPIYDAINFEIDLRGALSDLRRFLATERPLKMMKNAFYFTSKAFFILKILKFLSWFFGYVSERLD